MQIKKQQIRSEAIVKGAIIREFSGQSRVLASSSNFKAKEMDLFLSLQIPNQYLKLRNKVSST